MPDIKEKLIALFKSYKCEFENCDKCPHPKIPGACSDYVWNGLADHLVANGVTVQRWIPVTEERPKQSGEYNVWIVGASQAASLWYNSVEDVWFDDDYRDVYPVSHWMSLPEPPAEVTP